MLAMSMTLRSCAFRVYTAEGETSGNICPAHRFFILAISWKIRLEMHYAQGCLASAVTRTQAFLDVDMCTPAMTDRCRLGLPSMVPIEFHENCRMVPADAVMYNSGSIFYTRHNMHILSLRDV